MGGYGPSPKDPDARARRNRESTAGTLEAEPAKMPALGARRPDGTDWNAETKAAWKTWWTSSLAGRWIDAFVPGLRAFAVLYDDFWQAKDAATRRAIGAELRMEGREFGLSLMGLRTLGVALTRPKAETPDRSRSAPAALPPGADPRKVLQLDGRRRRTKAG